MFSSRLDWNLHPNSLSQLLNSKRRSGAPIIDLTESNPTRAGFDYPSGIFEALADARCLTYEPAPGGSKQARAAVSTYYEDRGQQVDPGRILLTASTSEAYSLLFKLLVNPGDEVLVPRPSYPLFDYLAMLESVRPVSCPLEYHGRWYINLESLEQCITPRTRAIVIVNPNNPTGSFIKRKELEQLVALCLERDLAIISDEVFSDYTFSADSDRVATLVAADSVLTFCLSGLSKAAGLPQMKLGWIVIAGPDEARQAAHERLELIADTYLSVGTPVQHAVPHLLKLGASVHLQIQKRVRENLLALQSAIKTNPSCKVLDVEGGWYAVVQVPRTHTEEQWCLELLQQDDVLVQPGFFYDFESEAYLVVSLLTPPADFREGLRRLLYRAGS